MRLGQPRYYCLFKAESISEVSRDGIWDVPGLLVGQNDIILYGEFNQAEIMRGGK
jgi:hypothetical protein